MRIRTRWSRAPAGRRFLSVGGGAFTPLALSGLAAWFDATRSTFQERTGGSATTPAAADNDPVGSWLDLSGNARHATGPADSKRPVLKLGVKNGRSVVRFDGTDDILSTATGFLDGAVDLTVFLVSRMRSAGVSGRTLADGTGGGSNWLLGTFGGNATSFYDGNFHESSGNAGSTNWFLNVARRDSTASNLFTNGAANTGATTTPGSGPNGFAFGNRGDETEPRDADVAEVVAYSRALTTSERQAVESYLNSKWGVF